MPTHISSPLPHAQLLDGPGVGGTIKARPEDFLVEELPLYPLSGEGEHLYLFIEKQAVSHSELMGTIRRHFGVRGDAVGFAGMKDKIGVTRQLVSVHLLRDPPVVELPHRRIRVLWSARHRNKLRRGHLAGNRFSIRIRDVDPLQAPLVQRGLRELAERGVPNYFGYQRFGYRGNNHILGLQVLLGNWTALLTELLGLGGSPSPDYQRQRRELFDAGQYAAALAQWTAADPAERSALRALASGKNPRQAAKAIHLSDVSFWVSSLQSAIFNRVLDQRLDERMLASLREGDLAYRHDRGHVFRVTPEELANPELEQRVLRLEVSPTGPLWGPGMTRAGGATDLAERAALDSLGLTPEVLTGVRGESEGTRRSLRTLVSHPEIDAGVDEHGPYIRVAFDLERGAYATVVLRELMGTEEAAEGPDLTPEAEPSAGAEGTDAAATIEHAV
jgi:tRNA pseudouridine13 synthase